MNAVIKDLTALAALDLAPEQKAYYKQKLEDARPVECVRMIDVFTPEQVGFLRDIYKTEKKQCYKNASCLVSLLSHPFGWLFPLPAKYVEGYVASAGLFSIEHAFVKYGDKYIDPTFERALHIDVRKEQYASLIELDCDSMTRIEMETGYYGNLYEYDYLKKKRPELAKKIAARLK